MNMKNILSLLLLVVLSIACQKDQSIGPPELLYQRWVFSQTRRLDDTTWAAPYRVNIDDKEYRLDESITYRRNGVVVTVNCCDPARFTRQGQTISYSDWNLCPTAFCGVVKSEIITQLTNDVLEVRTEYSVTRYIPIR